MSTGDKRPPDDDLRRALGRVIAMRRAELGLKRNDLRDRSDLSYPYLAELENGTKQPSQAALAAIAEALELRPSELLERAEALLAGEEVRTGSPWFHLPMETPMPPSAGRRSARRSMAAPVASGPPPGIENELWSMIEELVREVVRDELRRAGIEPGRTARRKAVPVARRRRTTKD